MGNSMTSEEKVKKASEITQTRILTQEDFKKIKLRQISKDLQMDPKNKSNANKSNTKAGSKRKFGDSTVNLSDNEEEGELVSLSRIEKMYKKAHSSKEERVASIMDGREGRGKFGAKEKRSNPHASTTNKEKRKNKTFAMVKHKLKGKIKRSYHDKQQALKTSLLKKMKNYKKR